MYKVEAAGRHLRLRIPDARNPEFHAIWLYENSSLAIDVSTQQRADDAFVYSLDLAVTGAEIVGERLALAFSDGKRGTIDMARLVHSSERSAGFRGSPVAAEPWDAGTELSEPVQFEDFRSDAGARLELLRRLARLGFAFVRDVPTLAGGLTEVTDLLGPIRETNFGRIEDVKVALNPTDLTLTARGIEQHTDNPYRWPTPGYTLLHCLHNDVQGGGSTLIDGLAAVDKLRKEAPDLLRAISTVRPTFRYEDGDTILQHTGSLVEIDGDGAVQQVRFSNRTEYVPVLPLAELQLYYAGRQRFAEILRDPSLIKRFRFAPGMLLIMDNYRCLHGRAPYEANSGTRHLQLCFLDRDVVDSRLRVLMRGV
jgi:gamma-butyrobetaine dioxygenase